MKTKIIIFLLLILSVIIARRLIDYNCVNNCVKQGYLYNYCLQVCSYNSGF